MVWTVVATLAVLTGAQNLVPEAVQTGDQEQIVSLDRIRKALERDRSSRLLIERPEPTFQVTVRELIHLTDPHGQDAFIDNLHPPRGGLYAFEQRQRLGNPWAGQPFIKVDVLPLLESVGQSIRKARHAHAQRSAQDEVERALTEFCAVNECP
jgi:hypothetical protein